MRYKIIIQVCAEIEIIFQVFMATKVEDEDGHALLFHTQSTRQYVPQVGMSYQMSIGEHEEEFVVTAVTDVERIGKVVVDLGEVAFHEYDFSVADVRADARWKVGEYHDPQ